MSHRLGLDPSQAFDALHDFAKTHDLSALDLSMHAALPEVFRADMLPLIRTNFLEDARYRSELDADVLFAPFCKHEGGHYFSFDDEVRKLLLIHIDERYIGEDRIKRIASFLLQYTDEVSQSVHVADDPVFGRYIEAQRWIALGFLDANAAAAQLASLLKNAQPGKSPDAYARIDNLITLLALPLSRFPELMEYAFGIWLLQTGDKQRAKDVLLPLNPDLLTYGNIKLDAPSAVLERFGANLEPGEDPFSDEATAPANDIAQSDRDQSSGEQFAGNTHREISPDKLRDGSQAPQVVAVPPGVFQMGSNNETGRMQGKFEEPQHDVVISSEFAIGIYAVTHAEYEKFIAETGREPPPDPGWGGGIHPVVNVSWEDAVNYTNWLSGQTQQVYRLPTESEWEYAARAGTTGAFGFEGEPTVENLNCMFESNDTQTQGRTVEVDRRARNAWGMFQMHGNVWEWVQDCWNASYTDAPGDGAPWLSGDCSERVIRGGAWSYPVDAARSASRASAVRTSKYPYIGFRVARELD